MINLNTFETHDRLQHFIKEQSNAISQGLSDCINKNDLSLMLQDHSNYIYIFAHPRTSDDGRDKRMLWQPRLIKPKAQTNSYLFRVQSKTDIVEICWMIPPRELWPEYKKGNITEHELVLWSIDQFQHNRNNLEESYKDDLPLERCKTIYQQILHEAKKDKERKDLYKSILNQTT